MTEPTTYYVHGIHCKACAHLIEHTLSEHGLAVRVSLAHKTLVPENVNVSLDTLNKILRPAGYSVSLEKPLVSSSMRDFLWALPGAVLFLAFFAALQHFGIADVFAIDRVTPTTAGLIGIIASVSTCMAVVGGLTLSISSNFAKGGDAVVPQLLFHAGRVAGFFLLGGFMGFLGGGFTLGALGTAIISICVGVVMLVLGVNLLDVFHPLKKLQPSLPGFIARHVLELKKINHRFVPFLLGVATFFLPCGFTQSMQLVALSSGTFWGGASIMLGFAFGTAPVLLALSFASLAIHNARASGVFFKTAGLVVIGFSVFNVLSAIKVLRVIL